MEYEKYSETAKEYFWKIDLNHETTDFNFQFIVK